jgi:hypothetical protein
MNQPSRIVTDPRNGFVEIITHDLNGNLAHLLAQRADFVILREACPPAG